MDHPVLLPRDSSMRATNHVEGERLRKVKEDKRKKKQRKLQARSEGRTPTATMMMMMGTMMR